MSGAAVDSIPEPANLERALWQVALPGSDVEVVLMPSGSFDVTVRRADGPVIVMQGYPHRSEFGLTPDIRGQDAGFDDGHPIILHDYDDAIDALFRAVRSPGS